MIMENDLYRGYSVPAARERAILAGRRGEPADQLRPQVLWLDDVVDDEFAGQPQYVDVSLISSPELLDLKVFLLRVGDRSELVVVNGVDRRLGPHHRDLGGRQRQRRVGF